MARWPGALLYPGSLPKSPHISEHFMTPREQLNALVAKVTGALGIGAVDYFLGAGELFHGLHLGAHR